MAMRKNVIFFPAERELKSERPITQAHSRVTISIGGERFAIDFSGAVTEINPVAAQIVSIEKRDSKRKGRRRPVVPE